MTDTLLTQLETVAQEVIRDVQIGRLTNAKLDVIGKYSQEAVTKTEDASKALAEHTTRVEDAMTTCKESVVAISGALNGIDALKRDAKQYEESLRKNALQLSDTKTVFTTIASNNKKWIDELWSAQDSQLALVRTEMTKSLDVAKATGKSFEEVQLAKRLVEMEGELDAIQRSQDEFERIVNDTLNQVTLSVTLIQQHGESIEEQTKALVEEQAQTTKAVNALYERVQESSIPLHVAQSTRIDKGMAETEHTWFELVNIGEATNTEAIVEEVQTEIEEQAPITEKKSFFQRLKAAFKGE